MCDSPANNNHPTFFGYHRDVTGYYGEIKPLNGCYGQPMYPRYYSLQKGYINGFSYPSYNEEIDVCTNKIQDENAPNEEGIEDCCMAYSDHSNRLDCHDLFSGDYWREACNCFANNSHQKASTMSRQETLDQGESEEACANYVVYQEESEYQPACDYDFWSSYQTWIGYEEQDDPFDEGSQGHIHASELGFYEGIFGYWPCLYQKMPHE